MEMTQTIWQKKLHTNNNGDNTDIYSWVIHTDIGLKEISSVKRLKTHNSDYIQYKLYIGIENIKGKKIDSQFKAVFGICFLQQLSVICRL